MYRQLARVCALALMAVAIVPASASAAGAIHPGVQTFTAGAQCTSNFVFSDGGTTYLGQAAHCSGTGAATDYMRANSSFSGVNLVNGTKAFKADLVGAIAGQ